MESTDKIEKYLFTLDSEGNQKQWDIEKQELLMNWPEKQNKSLIELENIITQTKNCQIYSATCYRPKLMGLLPNFTIKPDDRLTVIYLPNGKNPNRVYSIIRDKENLGILNKIVYKKSEECYSSIKSTLIHFDNKQSEICCQTLSPNNKYQFTLEFIRPTEHDNLGLENEKIGEKITILKKFCLKRKIVIKSIKQLVSFYCSMKISPSGKYLFIGKDWGNLYQIDTKKFEQKSWGVICNYCINLMTISYDDKYQLTYDILKTINNIGGIAITKGNWICWEIENRKMASWKNGRDLVGYNNSVSGMVLTRNNKWLFIVDNSKVQTQWRFEGMVMVKDYGLFEPYLEYGFDSDSDQENMEDDDAYDYLDNWIAGLI